MITISAEDLKKMNLKSFNEGQKVGFNLAINNFNEISIKLTLSMNKVFDDFIEDK